MCVHIYIYRLTHSTSTGMMQITFAYSYNNEVVAPVRLYFMII